MTASARPHRSSRRRRQRSTSEDVRTNRIGWERRSDAYERRFARTLSRGGAMRWGFWRVPESRLRLLGEFAGRDVLELGCGAARWSAALARRGGRVVGIDLSLRQLAHARRTQRRGGRRFPLVRGSAELLPFRKGTFDLVFCDWGAATFADPYRTVPECARVLRPGGSFVFATSSPIGFVGHDVVADRHVRRFARPYFGLHRLEFPGEVVFTLPYGEWMRLFEESGFQVERLEETQPARGARSDYLSKEEQGWARRWPLEAIWKVRRRSTGT